MKAAQVRRIPTDRIEPNPHNPRGLFDEDPMAILRESIQKLGILVPVTIYPKKRGEVDPSTDSFVLLDGERRWRCAQELGLRRIPAVIVEHPTDEQNILTMFHIHNVREGWQLMPTALKLQTLMEKLDEQNERRLAELTKLSVSQVRRCKILLTFPRKFQNMMLAPPSERMKADFFIELQRIRGPALKDRFPAWTKRGDEKCIDIFLEKYLKKIISAVTEFRRLAEMYRGALRKNRLERFLKELERFFRDPTMGIEDFNVPGVTFEKEFKEILRSGKRLLNQLNGLDADAIAADDSVLRILRRIVKTVQAKFTEALVLEPRNAVAGEN